MISLYNFTAYISYFFLRIFALMNPKMRLFVNGRKESFAKLSILNKEDKIVWFHAASLGEFEQARPIIESIKKNHSSHKIVVTFFSPSGYEVRKDYSLADVVCYLPFDTKKNVRKFVNAVHPEMAVIVKYEFWPNLLNELKRQQVKTILVSGIFRKDQKLFKPVGAWLRASLSAFHHFFVQDQRSKLLLSGINYSNITVCGDTRFDRVSKILDQDNTLDFVEEFKNGQYTTVAGSTWPEDEKRLVPYINQSEGQKFIIAPHNINPKAIRKLQDSLIKKTMLFSEKEGKDFASYEVLIIDTIGLLTKIYSYADVAYVGGAFKTGLHNILEPATFGVPIVIGQEYSKFKEAVDLVGLKGCFTVESKNELMGILNLLKEGEEFRTKAGKTNEEYIRSNKGATEKIVNYMNQKLQN